MSPDRCPVCRAGFRKQPQCPRCGADLQTLMRLVVLSHQLRQEARAELAAGRQDSALKLAQQAQSACPSPAGEALARLAGILLALETTSASCQET